MRIGLLRTTIGSEIWVSDRTSEFYREYLEKLGHEVIDIYISENIRDDIVSKKIELVFNATLGQYGEDGRISAIFDLLKIPYTHSDYISSAIAFDKSLTKIFLDKFNIKCAQYIVVDRSELLDHTWKNKIKNHQYLQNKTDFFIKPTRDGSSIDSSRITIDTDFNKFKFVSSCKKYLIEELIIGKEMCVGILNNKQIGIMEIKYSSIFYDYDTKYTPGKNTHSIPEISDHLREKILITCEKLHNIIGLNCLSRFDLLVTDNDFYILEVNANPAMTKTSLIPDMMRLQNMDLTILVESLIKTAKFNIS